MAAFFLIILQNIKDSKRNMTSRDKRFDQFFSSPVSKTRSQVVDQAVKIEHFVNSIILTLLAIEKDSSKSFGNNSSALSFSAKINLLLDLGILNTDQRKKISAFSEIRNQFVHNLEVSKISECPVPQKKNLLSLYKAKEDTANYEELYTKLYEDVLDAVHDLYTQIVERAGNRGEMEAKTRIMLMLEEELKKYAATDKAFDKKYKELYIKVLTKFSETPPPSDIENLPLL